MFTTDFNNTIFFGLTADKQLFKKLCWNLFSIIGSQAYHYLLSTILIYKMKATECLLNLGGICWKIIEQPHYLRGEKN